MKHTNELPIIMVYLMQSLFRTTGVASSLSYNNQNGFLQIPFYRLTSTSVTGTSLDQYYNQIRQYKKVSKYKWEKLKKRRTQSIDDDDDDDDDIKSISTNSTLLSNNATIESLNAEEATPGTGTTATTTSSVQEEGVVESVSLSNCHNVLYTGDIGIGSPPQLFTMTFTTSSTDVWVPSIHCVDDSCEQHPTWRKYKQEDSTTYKPLSSGGDIEDNSFIEMYMDGEYLEGQLVKDVIHLGGNITIQDQVFAQIERYGEIDLCQGQDGVLGLGRSDYYTKDEHPTILSNLKNIIKNPIFSMSLTNIDDYPDDPGQIKRDPANGPGHEYDNYKDGDYRPISTNSEIIFGGVNNKYYNGCLQWHNPATDLTYDNDESVEGDGTEFWSIELQAVRVNDEDLPYGDIIIIDTSSSLIIGPAEAISKFNQLNNIECFILTELGDAQPVNCDDGEFDAAVINCNESIHPLEFFVDGVTYTMGKEDLITSIETVEGQVCFLQILAEEGLPGWILGDVFLHKYYAAFNFDTKQIGLAEMVADENNNNTNDICDDDWPFDINYDGQPAPPTSTKTPAPDKDGDKNVPTTTPTTSALGSAPPPPPPPDMKKNPSSKESGLKESAGIAVAVVLGAILTVTVLSKRVRQRRRYRRAADRYDDGTTYSSQDVGTGGDMELPGLL